MKFVLLFLLATSSYALEFEEQPGFNVPNSNLPDPERIIYEINRLVRIFQDLKQFEIASIPTFYPVDEESFDVIFLLQKIEVEPSALTELRESTIKEVHAIRDLFSNHSEGITKPVDILAEMVHIIQDQKKDGEKLKEYLRSISDLTDKSNNELMTIIEKIRAHEVQFQNTVEKLIQSAKSTDLETVAKIRQRVVEITEGYSESYRELYRFWEIIAVKFDAMKHNFQAYLDFFVGYNLE